MIELITSPFCIMKQISRAASTMINEQSEKEILKLQESLCTERLKTGCQQMYFFTQLFDEIFRILHNFYLFDSQNQILLDVVERKCNASAC